MKVDDVMQSVDRLLFVPASYRAQAYEDVALPIGYGQTISQPSTVRQMLEWLDVQPGDTVLDVGSGSGWSTALLSRLTGHEGVVYAVERIEALRRMGETNCRRANILNVLFLAANPAIYGLPDYGPYDRILVSAAAQSIPKDLLEQLRPGGKLVIPVKHDIIELTKHQHGAPTIVTHPGFVFVPLV
jgi:protein-L-isoaspartate(D-aspartate) O-methyltransferase